MNKKILEIMTERDPIINLITDKNSNSPLNVKKNMSLPKNITKKKNLSLLTNEDAHFIHNMKTSYPLKSPLVKDTPKLNPTSTLNIRNNTFFQNNFYKNTLPNKNQNLNKMNYYTNTNSNFHSVRNISKAESDNLKKFNFSPEYISKNMKVKEGLFQNIQLNPKQNFLSPQNQNAKKTHIFSSLNPNEENNTENEKSKKQKILSKIEEIKLANSSHEMKINQVPLEYKTEIDEKAKQTIYSNMGNMNSPKKNLNFEVNPKVIKKENLVNISGIDKEVNYYDFPNNSDIPINFEILFSSFPGYENAKSSKKQISDLIRSYAANTYQGIIRNYNEDRVSIILNITKPPKFSGNWPKCSFFAIYDGHGGSACADFLRDNLHNYVTHDSNFPNDIEEAIKCGFQKADNDFINKHALTKYGDLKDKSGSCAIVILLVDNICYSANLGDSRAIMSSDEGKIIHSMSADHKPETEEEKKRIVKNGGKVYQTKTQINVKEKDYSNKMMDMFLGPTRVLPGRLSISRSFGDVEAKYPEFGGNPNVIIATPEIKVFNIDKDTDFIVLGCDGIFDQISSEEAVECVWKITNALLNKDTNIHGFSLMGVDLIMKSSLVRKTLDNITVLLVAFDNFDNYINKRNKEYEIFKKENLKTETPQAKKFNTTGKDIITSSNRVETEILKSVNIDKIFNNSSKNKDQEKGTKFNINPNRIKSTLTNFKKKDNLMGLNLKHINEDTQGNQMINKMNLEKLKNEINNNNNNNYKLPPVLNTETNFRESDDKRNSLYKNMFNSGEEKKRNFNINRLSLNDFKDNSNKIPIKIISLDNKKNFNNKNNEDNSDDNIISFDHIEEKFESRDFKSKYNHDIMVNKFEEKLNSKKKVNTEI